eukprot:2008313-Amphidinium_carterae.1
MVNSGWATAFEQLYTASQSAPAVAHRHLCKRCTLKVRLPNHPPFQIWPQTWGHADNTYPD